MTSSDPQEPLRRRRHAQAAQDSSGWSEDADASWADYRETQARPRPRRARAEDERTGAPSSREDQPAPVVPSLPAGVTAGQTVVPTAQTVVPASGTQDGTASRRPGARRAADAPPAAQAPAAQAPAPRDVVASPAASSVEARREDRSRPGEVPTPPAPAAPPGPAKAAAALPWWARSSGAPTAPAAADPGGLFRAQTPAASVDQVVPMVAAWPPVASTSPAPGSHGSPAPFVEVAASDAVDTPALRQPTATPPTPPAGWSPTVASPSAAAPEAPTSHAATAEPLAWTRDHAAGGTRAPRREPETPPAPQAWTPTEAWTPTGPWAPTEAATQVSSPVASAAPTPAAPLGARLEATTEAPVPASPAADVRVPSAPDVHVPAPDVQVPTPDGEAAGGVTRRRPRGRDAGPTTTIPVLRPGVPPTSGQIPVVALGTPAAAVSGSFAPVATASTGEPIVESAPRSRREAKLGRTGEQPVLTDVVVTPSGGVPVVPQAVAAAPRSNRAGRNLPMAIGVGVVLAVAVIASLFARKEAFVGVAALAVVLGLWELGQALRAGKIQIPVVPLAVGAVGMLVSAFVAGPQGLLVAFALTAFGVVMWRILDGLEGAVRDVAAGIFAAAYLPLLAGFAVLMLAVDDGPLRVVTFIAVTVASDIGGYVAGVLFGRRPMAPSVSPKKSWEGFAGSLLTCVGVGIGTVMGVLGGPWWAGALVGLAAVVTATVGDLSESLLKRDLGIKDMSSILPGHGGIMDRLDSLLLTAPVVYLLLAWWVPVG